MTTTTNELVTIIGTTSLYGDTLREEVDPSRFNIQMLSMLGRWAEDQDDLQRRWGAWEQSSWGTVGRTSDPFFRAPSSEFIGPRPDINVCGTSYCMAGQAVVQNDYRLLFIGGNSAEVCVKIEPTGEKDAKGRPTYRDVGTWQRISDAAQAVLGIGDLEAGDLFDGENCVPYIHARINGMCEQRNLPPLFDEAESTISEHGGYAHDCDW